MRTIRNFFVKNDEVYNGIYRIINLAERNSIKVRFYVIPLITRKLDSLIDIENEKIGKILRDIYERIYL
ncbi:MAG: hypothetical protein RMJ51_02635 [Candidatus Calescibacterium sp.]|nr:hypothetical protein [Candidatus Calescibacterium sp.]MDW8195124.1 hypothetical protein [Candidatus Calescibacterium sp.]